MKQSYAQRYPMRAKIQATIAGVSLSLLVLPLLPPVTVTIGSPAQATIHRGSAR